GSERWQIKILTPTAYPLKGLAIALTGQESNKETLRLIDELASDHRVLDIHTTKTLVNEGQNGDRFLFIIDQFEELFTLCKEPEKRRSYINNLLTAAQADGPTIVILALRADFYGHCLEYEQLRLLLEQH